MTTFGRGAGRHCHVVYVALPCVRGCGDGDGAWRGDNRDDDDNASCCIDHGIGHVVVVVRIAGIMMVVLMMVIGFAQIVADADPNMAQPVCLACYVMCWDVMMCG